MPGDRLRIFAQLSAPAAAQNPPSPPRQPGGGDLPPAEVQRLFDAYALVQAQEILALEDAQYAKFVTAMKAVQQTRRRNQQERMRLLRELTRMAGPNVQAGSDQDLTAALAALKQHDAKTAAELEQAYAVVDEGLTLRQRARFRLFEEQMERRKIELLLRARQSRREDPIRDRLR